VLLFNITVLLLAFVLYFVHLYLLAFVVFVSLCALRYGPDSATNPPPAAHVEITVKIACCLKETGRADAAATVPGSASNARGAACLPLVAAPAFLALAGAPPPKEGNLAATGPGYGFLNKSSVVD
jgi:hypothetical protein